MKQAKYDHLLEDRAQEEWKKLLRKQAHAQKISEDRKRRAREGPWGCM